jgi:8-oxo-dGTP pyrophosphatase MutT (NUDIX family)
VDLVHQWLPAAPRTQPSNTDIASKEIVEPQPSKQQEISSHTKRTWPRIRHDASAGGVAYRRPANGEVQIALIATRGGVRWQLPKGSREGHESALQTAIREVAEEVGLETEHVQFLKTIDYWYWDTYRKETPDLVHKSVGFYLLRVVGGELSDASYEVDAVGWFSLDEAQTILTFDGEQEVLALARVYLAGG